MAKVVSLSEQQSQNKCMFSLQQGNVGSPFQKAAKLIVIIDSLPTLKYHGERGQRYVLAERGDWRLEMPFTHKYNDI